MEDKIEVLISEKEIQEKVAEIAEISKTAPKIQPKSRKNSGKK